jgi:hypothetical protein
VLRLRKPVGCHTQRQRYDFARSIVSTTIRLLSYSIPSSFIKRTPSLEYTHIAVLLKLFSLPWNQLSSLLHRIFATNRIHFAEKCFKHLHKGSDLCVSVAQIVYLLNTSGRYRLTTSGRLDVRIVSWESPCWPQPSLPPVETCHEADYTRIRSSGSLTIRPISRICRRIRCSLRRMDEVELRSSASL